MHMILWMYILVQYSQATAKQDCATAARAGMHTVIAALSEQNAITVQVTDLTLTLTLTL